MSDFLGTPVPPTGRPAPDARSTAPGAYGGDVARPWTQGRLRDNTGLGLAVLVLGAILVLSDLLSALTSFSAVEAYRAAAELGEDPSQVFTTHDVVGLLDVVQVPVWIVGSLWLMRARSNAALLVGSWELRRSTVWCWLGWWVPVVCLWFPLQIVDEIWKITAGALPERGSARSRYRSVAPWWLLWLLYLFLDTLGSRLQVTRLLIPAEPGQVDTSQGVVPGLEVAAAVAGAVAYVAWLRVVRGLSRAQAELSGTAH